MIFLETQRLILRNVQEADAAIIHDYRNHALCARYQRGQLREYERIVTMVKNRSKDVLGVADNCFVAVAKKDTNELIGEIVVMPNKGTISLGYTFSYKHHRKGYAYEALSALIAQLHESFPEWDFISFTDPENVPSMGLLKKLGYKDMGYLQSKDSQVFGLYTTPQTEEEIAQAVQRESAPI